MMNDRPAASIAFLFASDTIPASATIVTSGRPCAAMNAWIVGIIVRVSALFLERLDHQREAGVVGQQPDGDLRLEPTFLEKPGSRNPSPASVSK